MVKKLWIDIETRSRVDLKKTGVYRYVRCPDFRILMASWTDDPERPVETALSYEEIAVIPGLWSPNVLKVAHNAPFERVCFSEFRYRLTDPGPRGPYFIPPEEYHDTQAVAAQKGLPQSLAKLAPALGAEEKDEAGTRLINLFCKPNRAGGWNGPDTHPLEWLEFMAYCDQDVYTLVDVDLRLGDHITETERQVYLADQRINDRGIAIDTELARQAVRAGAVNEAEQLERGRDLTGCENPNSVQQLGAWLKDQGVELPNLRAETVERALGTDVPANVREVLELRQELALAAPAKFATALASEVDGRLRGTLRYGGAHTLRWAGRGTQVQNLPRASFTWQDPISGKAHHDEADELLAIQELKDGEVIPAHELKKLVRPLFTGPFTVVDYAAIEARVIAWLAEEEWALQAFWAGRDIYVETAKQMGGLTRAQGKIAVLALGYNGGAGSLKAMATDRDIIDVDGVATMLSRVPDEVLQDMFVYPWRNANARIVRLWNMLDARFRTGGAVGPHLYIEKDGNDRLLHLPSGRSICYRKCGIQKRMKMNPRTKKLEEREVLTFWSPQGYRTDTYGGRLAENVTQAVARDVLAEALVRLEEAGYPVVAHVHDEILVEGTYDVDEIAKVMTIPPNWADGLPIDGEGFTCSRYRKG